MTVTIIVGTRKNLVSGQVQNIIQWKRVCMTDKHKCEHDMHVMEGHTEMLNGSS